MGANDCTRCGGKPYQCTCTEADFTNDELAERIAELETAYDILEGVKKELEQQNARLREFVLAVKEMREAQLNAGATGYRNGAFNAAQREAEKKVNEILEAL